MTESTVELPPMREPRELVPQKMENVTGDCYEWVSENSIEAQIHRTEQKEG